MLGINPIRPNYGPSYGSIQIGIIMDQSKWTYVRIKLKRQVMNQPKRAMLGINTIRPSQMSTPIRPS